MAKKTGVKRKSADKTIWSATPTPFLADGALDLASLDKVIDQHLRLGVTGLFMAGSCGEGPLMLNAQRDELVRATRRLAGKRLHIAVQVSDTSAARVRDNIARAEDAGADSVVIAPPWLMRFATEGFVRRYFTEPMEAATLPVGVYVLKQPADSVLDLALWTEIASHPKVSYIKDSSSTPEYRKAFVALKTKRPALLLETGDEFDVVNYAASGYDGCLLGTGILIGGLIRQALDALVAGDRPAADAWQKRSNEFLWDLFARDISLWMGGLKYALHRLGIFRTEFMHLDYPITTADRKRIDAALERERPYIRPE
ncbi:MAG: dihydrodipicolinate synthase family protein [Candidatus Brocadiia bacterium]|jgi:4-hydroxy-tetrahydrodipicolinate synthase